MSAVLLTGATGFLGSYLLRDLLAAGTQVAVLVRSKGDRSAESRVGRLMDRFRADGRELPRGPRVVAADLLAPDLSLSGDDRAWIAAHCDRILHCAADLTFQARKGEPYRTNVDGTRHILRLCERAGIGEFHLVSTAYVCGLREGRILEDELECGQAFANDYERSKFLSELLVRGAPFLERTRVYRPSVIVGDSGTGFNTSEFGLYALLRVAAHFGTRDRGEVLDVLGLEASDALNLVPVDWVSAAIAGLVTRRGDDAECTYHLTSPNPVAAGHLVEVIQAVGFEAAKAPRSALDAALETYRPYFRNHPEFDTSNARGALPDLPCPTLAGSRLEQLVRYAAGELGLNGTNGQLALLLCLGGTEEAQLDLTDPLAARPADPGAQGGARARATCSRATLERLIDGLITVEEAIYSGRLAIEGDRHGLPGAIGLLEAFVGSERSGRNAPMEVRPA